ncbi:TetR/AcrR family transcriptional regulator [bacterium]|nr:TetR/AcrR family transcriptional regulator [bacterium]
MAKFDRKAKEKSERIQDIVDSAMELFAEKGFHEVTMDMIAERVGLSKGTLYLYFKNKETLFISIVQEKTDLLFHKLIEAVKTEGEYGFRLEKFIYNYLNFFDEYRYYFKIIHSEKSRVDWDSKNRMRKHVLESYMRFQNLILSFVKEGIECGYLRNINSEVAMKSLRGILNSFTFDVVLNAGEGELKAQVPDVLDVFLNGTVNK